MGKAYAGELALLQKTLEWANRVRVDPLRRFVRDAAAHPLIAIGSGGSMTAAHFAALLHRHYTSNFARHATPLDAVLSEPALGRGAALLLSASGKNQDILTALDACVSREVQSLGVLCTQERTVLGERASGFLRAHIFEEDAPAGKDGYLATNSLLATLVLLARAYGCEAPDAFGEESRTAGDISAAFRDRHMVQVLFAGWGAPIATDLESKLNESALAAAQVADFRNFGHGRHLWLARRAEETVVIAIVTPSVEQLAERTLALIPKHVPIIRLATQVDGPLATIGLFGHALHLVGTIGVARDVDPGRPHVPDFGRKLYHVAPAVSEAPTAEPAVVRKLARMPLLDAEVVSRIVSSYQAFMGRLRLRKFEAVVLDYDGTLCTREQRFDALPQEISQELCRLLEHGMRLGIATGRGRSVRQSLQQSLPHRLWERVLVGYYNGSSLAPLDDDRSPNRSAALDQTIADAYAILRDDPIIAHGAQFETRSKQLTIEPHENAAIDALAAQVMSVLGCLEPIGIRVVSSSHSVDVLAPGVSKRAVVDKLRPSLSTDADVLCIGDRGRWPGNDFALLAEPFSLSVDEVSSSTSTCWNLAPLGVLGPAATLVYLRALKRSKGGALKFDDREHVS